MKKQILIKELRSGRYLSGATDADRMYNKEKPYGFHPFDEINVVRFSNEDEAYTAIQELLRHENRNDLELVTIINPLF